MFGKSGAFEELTRKYRITETTIAAIPSCTGVTFCWSRFSYLAASPTPASLTAPLLTSSPQEGQIFAEAETCAEQNGHARDAERVTS